MALTQRWAGGEVPTATKWNETGLPVVSTTADISAPYTGQLVFATSDTRLWRYTGSAWTVFSGGPTWAIYRVTAQSIPNNTWTSFLFTDEDTDTDAMHSVSSNTDRVTISKAGLYAINGKTSFAANATGARGCRLTKNAIVINGGSIVNDAGATFETIVPSPPLYVQCAVNDILRVQGFQNSGGALNTATGTVGLDSAGNFPLFTGTWLRD
jgi:hypothetical protein